MDGLIESSLSLALILGEASKSRAPRLSSETSPSPWWTERDDYALGLPIPWVHDAEIVDVSQKDETWLSALGIREGNPGLLSRLPLPFWVDSPFKRPTERGKNCPKVWCSSWIVLSLLSLSLSFGSKDRWWRKTCRFPLISLPLCVVFRILLLYCPYLPCPSCPYCTASHRIHSSLFRFVPWVMVGGDHAGAWQRRLRWRISVCMYSTFAFVLQFAGEMQSGIPFEIRCATWYRIFFLLFPFPSGSFGMMLVCVSRFSPLFWMDVWALCMESGLAA